MFQRQIHSTRPAAYLAALVLVLLAGGCALFQKETWNLNHYRDERAVDIDRRLEKADAAVKSPF